MKAKIIPSLSRDYLWFFYFRRYGILVGMDELAEKLVVLENKTREFADRL